MLTLRKYNVCRLCLCGSKRLMDIFEDNCGVEFSLPEAVQDLLQIEVNDIVGLPWHICSCCLEKLVDFRLFKRRCLECKVTFDTRLQSAIHLQNSSGKIIVQPPVMVVENGSGTLNTGNLPHDTLKKNLGNGRMDALSSSGVSSGYCLRLKYVKQENFTGDECKKEAHGEVVNGENLVENGNKKNDETAVNGHSSRAAEVDFCPVKVEPVGEVYSEVPEHFQDVGSEALNHVEGTVLLSPTHEASPPLLPSVQLNTTVDLVVESSSCTRRCKNSLGSSRTKECLHAEGDMESSSDEGDDESYVPEVIPKSYSRVPFHIKEKVVAAALEHPKWSLSSLSSKVSAKLKRHNQLELWKKQVAESRSQSSQIIKSKSSKIVKSKSSKLVKSKSSKKVRSRSSEKVKSNKKK